MLPPLGNFRRYRVLEMVNFITTELHKRFGFLFNPDATDEMKQLRHRATSARSSTISTRELGDGPFLMGDELTLPDPYLFVIGGWTDKMIGLDRWPNLTRVPRAHAASVRRSATCCGSKDCLKRNPRARAPAQ